MLIAGAEFCHDCIDESGERALFAWASVNTLDSRAYNMHE